MKSMTETNCYQISHKKDFFKFDTVKIHKSLISSFNPYDLVGKQIKNIITSTDTVLFYTADDRIYLISTDTYFKYVAHVDFEELPKKIKVVSVEESEESSLGKFRTCRILLQDEYLELSCYSKIQYYELKYTLSLMCGIITDLKKLKFILNKVVSSD